MNGATTYILLHLIYYSIIFVFYISKKPYYDDMNNKRRKGPTWMHALGSGLGYLYKSFVDILILLTIVVVFQILLVYKLNVECTGTSTMLKAGTLVFGVHIILNILTMLGYPYNKPSHVDEEENDVSVISNKNNYNKIFFTFIYLMIWGILLYYLSKYECNVFGAKTNK